jgi:hypothetical protein
MLCTQIPRRFQHNPSFNTSKVFDTKPTATSQELWETEYEHSFCHPEYLFTNNTAAESNRPANPAVPLTSAGAADIDTAAVGAAAGGGVVSANVDDSALKSLTDARKKKQPPQGNAYAVGDGYFVPFTCDADTMESLASTGSWSNRKLVGSNTSATLNSAEQATFVDSLDGSLGSGAKGQAKQSATSQQQAKKILHPTAVKKPAAISTAAGEKPCVAFNSTVHNTVISPRKEKPQQVTKPLTQPPTQPTVDVSTEKVRGSSGKQPRYQAKNFPARSCYSLRATNSPSPPRDSKKSAATPRSAYNDTTASVADSHELEEDFSIMDDEDSENNNYNVFCSNSNNRFDMGPGSASPRMPGMGGPQIVPDHKKWLKEQKQSYDKFVEEKRAATTTAVASAAEQPDEATGLLMSSSAFEAPKTRRHFRTENGDNYFDWKKVGGEWSSAAEERAALNLKHKHHDLLINGNTEKGRTASATGLRPTQKSEFQREYCTQPPKLGVCPKNPSHVFGKASPKHQPLWVNGPAPKDRPKSAPASSVSSSTTMCIDTSGAHDNRDADSNATIPPATTGSYTIASINSKSENIANLLNNNNNQALKDSDSSSSITSVQAPTHSTSAGATTDSSNAAARMVGHKLSQPSQQFREKAARLSRGLATSKAHPQGCPCSSCVPKVPIPYTVPKPEPVSEHAAQDVPRKHR